jgi:2,3-bisphosphoglycerate-dependent phosphoglycerate mutase
VGHTRIVLVRHGESLAQERRIVGGHAGCEGLSKLGVRQAEALRDRLIESAELTGDLEVRQDCDFCEGHPSAESDGMAWEEFDQRWPMPADWSPEVARDPGGESWAQMRDRVTAGLDRLAAVHDGETVVVACHGGVVLHSMFRWLLLEPVGSSGRAWLDPINSSITEWRMADNPFWAHAAAVQLVRFNDHGHLRGDLLPRGRRPA